MWSMETFRLDDDFEDDIEIFFLVGNKISCKSCPEDDESANCEFDIILWPYFYEHSNVNYI